MDPQNPEAILQRLEELRRWQEEQQLALQQKQIAQRDLLEQEQRKLYEMFGMSLDSSLAATEQTTNDGTSLAASFDESRIELMRNLETNRIAEQNIRSEPRPPDNAAKIEEVPTEKPPAATDSLPKPKQKFLRRGEGIQNRLGVDPDKFRLNNLPKYKFTGSHRKSKFFRNAVHKLVVKQADPIPWIDDDCDLGVQLMDRIPPPKPSEPFAHHAKSPEKTWATSLSAPSDGDRRRSNVSMQDTPMREKIRQQQADIDELNDFEAIENHLQDASSISNPCSTEPAAKQPQLPPTSDDETDDDCPAQPRQPLAAPQVRFVSQVRVNPPPDEYDSETGQSIDIDDMSGADQTSTPNTHSAFRAFKAKLFRARSDNAHHDTESTIADDESHHQHHHINVPLRTKPAVTNSAAVLQHTDALKHKLAELEKEIALFRTQNAALTAATQQHQLDRAALDEARTAHEDRLVDDRARLEMQIHDERMKLVAERETLERRSRELRGPNRREREETAALRQRVEQLERDAAGKEQQHVLAQSRLRAQLRTMEKDLKEFTFEMEQMRKENKKLEAENVRLRRQSNNKMLSEINRNIARLAVVAQPSDENVEAGNNKQRPHGIRNKTARNVAPPAETRVSSQTRQRTRSVPNLTVPVTPAAVDSSSSEESEAEAGDASQRSHYFQPDYPASSTTPSKENRETITATVAPPAANSKREIVNADGSKDILYPNGNLKKVSADSMRVRMLYFNKDIKETNVAEGTVKYYYAETNTWQTSYLDGLEILEFPNGQIEHRHRDGKIEVHFPNGSTRLSDPANGAVVEEWCYADGTRVEQRRNGERILSLPNGQREVHTAQHKRREYPDGTVKLVYPDGSQETRYSNGRVRLKDNAGKLVMDSQNLFAAAPVSAAS